MASVEQGSSGNLTPLLNGIIIAPLTVLESGNITLSSAGTAQQFPTATISTVTIRAGVTNVGIIYIGSSDITGSPSTGFQCSASETVSLDINQLNKVWMNGTNTGDYVSYIYLSQ